MKRWAFFIGLFGLFTAQLQAHEMRPGYLEIKEVTPATYSVLWKVPMRGNLRLQLDPEFPDSCSEAVPPVALSAGGAQIKTWTLRCNDGLADQSITIAGLENTLTDVLARVQHLDGATQTARITPGESSFTITASPSKLALSATYLWLGIEHILLGIDHLLFVFALLLIVNGIRRLIWTITAFTVAHSITLAGATLGYVHVPQQPVEAIIALSILFLATEIVHSRRGRPGYAERWPWLVAFIFGLLHGFGFAGALADVGLPEHAIPFALVFFNIGVELGQLAFVAVVLASAWLLHKYKAFPLRSTEIVTTYIIGGVAAYWTIERVAGFWT
ncbi:MAG: HupE/UreJ family protein [Gammaproteobacteria bacterium]|nr:HupE/UreJ family protein [Gammaproteobacteria bacterium]